MHYYKRNIGDYHKKAGRLTMLQHGAYTLLLDACYDREKFPTLDEAIEWLWANSDEEISAIKFVLGKFFTEDNGVFVQHRIESELNDYAEKALTNKRIAIEREQKRRLNSTNRAHYVDESKTNLHLTNNQEPLTNNQEPENINQKDNKAQQRFTPPTHQEALQYFQEKGFNNQVEASKFVDFYEMKGWMVGKNKMKDWKAAIRHWTKNMTPVAAQQQPKRPRAFGS